MELAIGLCRNKVAQLVTEHEKIEEVAAHQLLKRGLPTQVLPRARFATDLQGWRLLPTEEANAYPSAFGFSADMSNHQVFEFFVGEHRYLVPALVLVRAALKNKKSLIAAAFQPQGLELAITPIFEDDLLSDFWIQEESGRSGLNTEFLHWLYAYPSARRMFHSVFRHALEGRLGISLPLGIIEATACFRSDQRKRKTHFVTNLNICRVTTAEFPLDYCLQRGSIITYRRSNQATVQLAKSRALELVSTHGA
ncbi:hypothetical protein GJ698_06480 [Pseudoduganella sp. FT26W]|uniref:Uncharacterized protein n=1 Tax=Duganella aquatilis TaxID=2666082 RepID=A0A844D8Z9_9BURK|nr:hypothetical protein [Duganella aquatilis]MRW83739.1 hypothetical protein [Duganella aquatilis]